MKLSSLFVLTALLSTVSCQKASLDADKKQSTVSERPQDATPHKQEMTPADVLMADGHGDQAERDVLNQVAKELGIGSGSQIQQRGPNKVVEVPIEAYRPSLQDVYGGPDEFYAIRHFDNTEQCRTPDESQCLDKLYQEHQQELKQAYDNLQTIHIERSGSPAAELNDNQKQWLNNQKSCDHNLGSDAIRCKLTSMNARKIQIEDLIEAGKEELW